MKILLCNYEFPPVGGGAGVATYNLAKELAALQHDVFVLTSKSKQQEEFYQNITIERVPSWRKGIHDCGYRGALTYVFGAYPKLLSLLRRNQFDVIHYFFSIPTGLLSVMPGAHQKIPYIVSLRGSDVPGYDLSNPKLEFIHQLCKPITRHIWKRAHRVVAVTNSLNLTAHQTAPFQSIDVIPNGIDADIFNTPYLPKKQGRSFRLICVSRLIKRKGIEHILQAIHELGDEDLRLLIVGSGNYEQHLKKRCSELGLNKTVSFYGYCNQKNLSLLFSDSDVFILTPRSEAFGNVFAEAMVSGLPIIGSKLGGILDLISEKNGILVEPENIGQLKQAIITMKESSNLRRIMGEANRNKILTQYNWKRIAKKYVEVYKSAVGS